MKQICKAIVFDAYGTLFDIHSITAECEALFPGKGTALSQLWRKKQLEYSWLTSLIGDYLDFAEITNRALQFAISVLSLELTTTQRQQLLAAYQHLLPFPEVATVLQQLQSWPLAILSNGSPSMLHAVVDHAGLTSLFTQIISVDEQRIYKPHPTVYALAANQLQLAPNTIAFVSSNGWDIVGAGRYGLQTFWINRTQAPAELIGRPPDATLHNLTELYRLLH
jgi:2-haloacid dehalogenase